VVLVVLVVAEIEGFVVDVRDKEVDVVPVVGGPEVVVEEDAAVVETVDVACWVEVVL
jgi:hypothetical protein